MKPKYSLPQPQVPSTALFLESVESSLHPHTFLPEDLFNYYSYSRAKIFQVVFSIYQR